LHEAWFGRRSDAATMGAPKLQYRAGGVGGMVRRDPLAATRGVPTMPEREEFA